jgi:hypothetical protein
MATLVLSAAGAAIGAGLVERSSGPVGCGDRPGDRGHDWPQQSTSASLVPDRSRSSVGRIDRLRLTGAGEGAPIGQVWGRMRIGGQVIWATEFTETGHAAALAGKGAPKPKINDYSYSSALRSGLCEGEIQRVGRVWADGNEISART